MWKRKGRRALCLEFILEIHSSITYQQAVGLGTLRILRNTLVLDIELLVSWDIIGVQVNGIPSCLRYLCGVTLGCVNCNSTVKNSGACI